MLFEDQDLLSKQMWSFFVLLCMYLVSYVYCLQVPTEVGASSLKTGSPVASLLARSERDDPTDAGAGESYSVQMAWPVRRRVNDIQQETPRA